MFAQNNTPQPLALVAEQWAFEPGSVEFSQEAGTPTMHLPPDAGKVVAKNLDFSDGTIEFDVKPRTMTFCFRYQDAYEHECFYFRMARAGTPEALQYAPVIDGVLMWDIYPHYQSQAAIATGEWNHVKLVISGAQMRLYINHPAQPTLEVDRLAGNPGQGTIAFEGDMVVSNLVITPGETEGLASSPGIDPTRNDARYIRCWAVSDPVAVPEEVDFSDDLLPNPDTPWRILKTERRGLINLTRTFGSNPTRSIVWLKVKIESAQAQSKNMRLGFVDDLWVFLNGQLVYLDKNWQGRLMEKVPGGRCSIENTSFTLPLKEGTNELLVGLANDNAWGRGAVARLDDTEGIELAPAPTFDVRLGEVSESTVSSYVGTYQLPNGKKISLRVEDQILVLSGGNNFFTTSLYPEDEHTFFSRKYDLEVKFIENLKSKVTHFVVYNQGQQMLEAKRLK